MLLLVFCFLFVWSFRIFGSWLANILHQNFLRFTPPPPSPQDTMMAEKAEISAGLKSALSELQTEVTAADSLRKEVRRFPSLFLQLNHLF